MLKCFIAMVVALMLCSPLYSAQPQTLVDGDGKAVGTAANPLYISGGGDAEGWDAEGDGIVFDSATYTNGLTISDVTVTLDNAAINFLNTDGVMSIDGSLSMSESITASDVFANKLNTTGESTLNFTDNEGAAQFQLDGTLAMDLTIQSGSASLSTSPMKIGTDLTTDGTNIYWKGAKLN